MTAAYEVSTDGRVVWVNGLTGALGRFGVRGIDVHSEDTTTCLHCTHEWVTAGDWEIFKVKMLEHHGIIVADEYKPDRFR